MRKQFQTFFVPFFRITSPFLPKTDFFGISYKIVVTSRNILVDDTKLKHFWKKVVFSENCGIMHMKSAAPPFKEGAEGRISQAPRHTHRKTSGVRLRAYRSPGVIERM